jgi:comEA protein
MKKKILIPCTAATALLIGFLLGYSFFQAIPSDSFAVTGQREGVYFPAVSDVSEAGKICINTASLTELTDLPGVGPVIAGRIIDHRERHGAFGSVEELLQVGGIGERVLEGLSPWAKVTGGEP